MVVVTQKINVARNWFWRVSRFFLHLIGVRESDPPIFSLFRLRRSYCIVFRFDCLSCLFSGLPNHKLSSQHLVVLRLTGILTNSRNQACAARNWTLNHANAPSAKLQNTQPTYLHKNNLYWLILQRTVPRRNNVGRVICNCSEPTFTFLLHSLKHRDASDNTLPYNVVEKVSPSSFSNFFFTA